MRKLFTIARNHIRIEFEDRSTIVFFLILPLVFTVIVGSALGGSTSSSDNRAVVMVVDVDHSSVSQEVIAALQTSQIMRIETPSSVEADQAFGDNQALPVLTLASGLQSALFNGQPVELHLRAANDSRALAVEQEIRATLEQTSGAVTAARAAVAEAERVKAFASEQARQDYFNASLKTAQALMKNPPARLAATQPAMKAEGSGGAEGFAQSSPGQLVTWVMTTLFGVAGFLVYERINGTARRLAVMPMRNSTILGGNFAGRFALGLVQMGLMVGFGALILKVPWGQSPVALVLMLVSFGLAGTAFGIMLGTLTRTTSQAGGLSILCAMLFAALGGCWWPLEITPPLYQTLVKILPSTWAMQGFTDIIVYGKGVPDVLPDVVILLIFAAAYFFIGVRRLRFD